MSDSLAGGSMYESEAKIYPREVSGTFNSLRTLAVYVLLGIYYLLPWINIGDRQALLFDLPARQFHIFGLTLWPQDFPLLALLLIFAAISLFFFTALAGRLWCGFACPQTVWTEVFIWMEQWTEGKRTARIRLDRGPWTAEKIARKTAKQILWISFAAFTGFTFVGYFTPIRELSGAVVQGALGPWETFWILFYGFATYGNAGYLREQVCKYMCPYARFQSAMFDKDTLIISYDTGRGEPRGSRRRGSDYKASGLGDCVDCNKCVQVCPTGIDIRDGLQYECIACAACIDACNDVMTRLEYPRNLIRYTTEHMAKGGNRRILRARTVVYASILTILLAVLIGAMLLRTPLIVDVIRDRNTLFREVGSDLIENSYTLKIINQGSDEKTFRITVSGLPNIRIEGTASTVSAQAGQVLSLPTRVQVPRQDTAGISEITFTVESLDRDEISVAEKSRFLGPSH
ncbi:MAG TPA: cytochrome c oxidase accessory protein CcoG [Woeseiaceae bacterium]